MIFITSDLHLTAKPEDEYRFGLFKWIQEQITQHHITDICILGDVTDAKDRHPAELVHRIVSEFRDLSAQLKGQIHILQGNHDYYDRHEYAFFSFLQHIGEKIHWHDRTHSVISKNGNWVLEFVPFYRDEKLQEQEILNLTDDVWRVYDNNPKKYLLTHHTFEQAFASNGQQMRGAISPTHDRLKSYSQVISGDIHVPQQLGLVTYCGSPYSIRYNDAFKPRVLLLNPETNELQDLHFPCIRRQSVEIQSVEDLKTKDISKGDQVKVKVKISRASIHEIPEIKRQIIQMMESREIYLQGIEILTESATTTAVHRKELTRQQDEVSIIKRYGRKENYESMLIDVGIQVAQDRYALGSTHES